MKRYGYFVVYRVIIVSFWMMNLKYLASICVRNFCSVWGQRCIDLVVLFASLYQHNLLTLVLVTWNRTLCASSVDTTYIYLHWCAAAALPRLFAYRSVICHTSFLAVACVRNHLFCVMGSYYMKLRSDAWHCSMHGNFVNVRQTNNGYCIDTPLLSLMISARKKKTQLILRLERSYCRISAY